MKHAEALIDAYGFNHPAIYDGMPAPPSCPGELELVGADVFNTDSPALHYQCLQCGKFVSAVGGEPHHWNEEWSDESAIERGYRPSPKAS